MAAKKKLLIVAGCMNTGGLEKQLLHLAANLEQSKYIIDFTSDQEECDYKRDILSSGWGYIYLPAKSEVGLYQYCKKLYKLLRNNDYDIVHSHELFHSGIVMYVAWLAGVKKRIAHSHSTKDDNTQHNAFLKIIYQRLMRRCIDVFATDCIGCSTQAAVFLFGKIMMHTKKVHVIVNSIDTKLFFPQSNTRKAEEWKTVVHVGRFVDVKNQAFIIQIARESQISNANIRFVFVGDGPTFDLIRTQACDLERCGYVIFLGMRSDIPDILRESDVFILPSKFEGMPLSLIEAQTSGLPCVVADHITNEIDIGLGLIKKASLDLPASYWLSQIKAALKIGRPSLEAIKIAVSERGFDNVDYVKKIDRIYNG